jgi:hypothetical protein
MAANAILGYREDAPLSFLPLAMFERLALYLFCLRMPVIRRSSRRCRATSRVGPTIMTGVPRVFEKFHHAVIDAVASAPAPRKALFHWAMRVAATVSGARLAGRRPPLWAALQRPLADALVLRKIRARVGGRLRLMVSGSAPWPATGEFLFAVGLPISGCYGLTESSPGITGSRRHGSPRDGRHALRASRSDRGRRRSARAAEHHAGLFQPTRGNRGGVRDGGSIPATSASTPTGIGDHGSQKDLISRPAERTSRPRRSSCG